MVREPDEKCYRFEATMYRGGDPNQPSLYFGIIFAKSEEEAETIARDSMKPKYKDNKIYIYEYPETKDSQIFIAGGINLNL